MKEKVPATIEVIFCVDQSHGGHIVSGAEDWISVDMLDGCSMDDNGILLPNDLDSGIYRGKLTFSSWMGYEGDYDMDIKLSDVEEYLPFLTPQSIENDKQKIAQLERRIALLEPEENFISVIGNVGFGGEYIEFSKVNDTTFHLKVGCGCIYIVDMDIPCEAFTGLMWSLLEDQSGGLSSIIASNLPWSEEANKKIIEKL